MPIDILLAISRVESGRRQDDGFGPWPWTINADGVGRFYATKAEAVAAAQSHLIDGTVTFDSGCFQLNYRYHGAAFTGFDDLFDPEQNAEYAAQFLLSLYEEKGSWADAVAAYHSRTPDLAQGYLNRVKAVLNGPPPSQTAPIDANPRSVIHHENTFPLLKAGAQGGYGSLVPLTSGRARLIGGNS
ncbi:MAG: transglycosylase SLT domain-containing protein [Pseudomonadota bacterium]